MSQIRSLNTRRKIPDCCTLQAPAKHLISYENVVFSTGFGHERTEYQGPPTAERNALWDDLYGCKFNSILLDERGLCIVEVGISRIPMNSAAKLVNKTVPIPGEEGQYVVQLNVFHQLHCLVRLMWCTWRPQALTISWQNMLRKRLYSKVEYPPDHELMGIEHLEHCYDALRQSLMCAADITPLPWQWVEEAQEAKEVARVAHTCRNFESIRSWAKENAVEHFDRTTFVPDPLKDH